MKEAIGVKPVARDQVEQSGMFQVHVQGDPLVLPYLTFRQLVQQPLTKQLLVVQQDIGPSPEEPPGECRLKSPFVQVGDLGIQGRVVELDKCHSVPEGQKGLGNPLHSGRDMNTDDVMLYVIIDGRVTGVDPEEVGGIEGVLTYCVGHQRNLAVNQDQVVGRKQLLVVFSETVQLEDTLHSKFVSVGRQVGERLRHELRFRYHAFIAAAILLDEGLKALLSVHDEADVEGQQVLEPCQVHGEGAGEVCPGVQCRTMPSRM